MPAKRKSLFAHASVAGHESERMSRSVGSVPQGALSKNRERRRGSAILQRLEFAKRRTDAALIIQRAWHRYYSSHARRCRHAAARIIQHAWGGSVLIENAKRELQFLRWLRGRRCRLRACWKLLCSKKQAIVSWALVTIARAKNVYIWRRRLAHRRLARYAKRLQKWWRRLVHERKTYAYMLWCTEVMEYMKSEKVIRGNMLRAERATFLCLRADVQQQIAALRQAQLRDWLVQHKWAAAESCDARGDERVELSSARPQRCAEVEIDCVKASSAVCAALLPSRPSVERCCRPRPSSSKIGQPVSCSSRSVFGIPVIAPRQSTRHLRQF